MTKYSFEIMPPRNPKTANIVLNNISRLLNDTCPEFVSVTYGAGGSEREGTLNTIQHIRTNHPDIKVGMHLTHFKHTKSDLMLILDEVRRLGVSHIVALRGDIPEGVEAPEKGDKRYFQSTPEFVQALSQLSCFNISVAAYPIPHPEALSPMADIDFLKRKLEAGATQALTQVFFDNNLFFDFMEKVEQANIRHPIIPGILPIEDPAKSKRFLEISGLELPSRITRAFSKVSGQECFEGVAQNILSDQILDLEKNGVNHIHIYTLNRVDLPIWGIQQLKR